MLLNIGTAIGKTGMHLTLPEIVSTCERAGLQIRALAVHQSVDATERTVVVELRSWPVDAGPTLMGLSTVLGQDCVAVWMPQGQFGKLVGPRAQEWGAFDPSFFLLLDGTRLQDSLPVANVAA